MTNNMENFMNKLIFILLTAISMLFIGCGNNSTGSSFEEIDSSSSITEIDSNYTEYHVDSTLIFDVHTDYDTTLISNYNHFNGWSFTYEEILSDMTNFDESKIINYDTYESFTIIKINETETYATFIKNDGSSHENYNISDSSNFTISDGIDDNNLPYTSFSTWKRLDENHILRYCGGYENRQFSGYMEIIYISK